MTPDGAGQCPDSGDFLGRRSCLLSGAGFLGLFSLSADLLAGGQLEEPLVDSVRTALSAAIANSDGGDLHSAEAVRHTIRHMIEAESSKDVLSDDQIVDELTKRGIEIARRTVAKYRESMNISSSVQRRREKRAIAGAYV